MFRIKVVMRARPFAVQRRVLFFWLTVARCETLAQARKMRGQLETLTPGVVTDGE